MSVRDRYLPISIFVILPILFDCVFMANAADGEGTAIMTPTIVSADEYVVIQIEFTVGESGITEGGGIRIWMPNENKRHGLSEHMNWSKPQVDDDSVIGYTHAATTNGGVTLLTDILEVDPPAPQGKKTYCINITVNDGNLVAGDKVTVRYGEKTMGNPGARTQFVPQNPNYYTPRPGCEDGEPNFTITVDANADGHHLEIAESPDILVVGSTPSDIRVFIPSLVKSGEPFDVKVVVVDDNGYRAKSYIRKVAFISTDPDADVPEDYLFTSTDNCVKTFSDVFFINSGVQTINIIDVGTKREFTSNPCYVLSDFQQHIQQNIYWGDIHWHSILSDGLKTPDEGYIFAREESGLDFTAMTDHENMHPELDNTWSYAQDKALSFNEPDNFITLSAYEWTSLGMTWGEYGHRDVYYLNDYEELYPRWDLEGNSMTPDELWENISTTNGGISIGHHVASRYPGEIDWSFANPLEPLVEIASLHGVAEYYYDPDNPWGDPDIEPYPDLANSPVDGNFVRDALAMNHRLGIISSSDSHLTLPGYDGFLVHLRNPPAMPVVMS